MSNRRVKGIGYDDDDVYDSYDEEYDEEQNELTEEDRIQMQEGTTRVKSVLGSQYSVTDKEIQDALWHYYYDVDKSVAYLKNLRQPIAQTQKKMKTPIANGKKAFLSHACRPSRLLHNPWGQRTA
jgi:elongation factor 1 alpha-like protein